MKYQQLCRLGLKLLTVAALALPEFAGAQTFFTYNDGDLLVGFRKTGNNQGSYELVANIGSVTNLEALTAGSTVTVGSFATVLSDSFSDNNNLQWSVTGAFGPLVSWAGFPPYTLWYTIASPGTSSQSTAPMRLTLGAQQVIRPLAYGIGSGARTVSQDLGSTNVDNNRSIVREATGNSSGLSSYIASLFDSGVGNFRDNLSYSVENTNPPSFTSAVRSDLYQSVPGGSVDPNTGQSSGSTYFVGYFLFNPNGTMTFTRATATQTFPPPPPVLSIHRAGTTSTISFGTTNGATYTLYYTNTAGLAWPLATWPSSPTTVTGDNQTNSFTDVTSDSSRIYRVGAH